MALTKVGKEGVTGISNSSDATAITIDSSEAVTMAGAATVAGTLTANALTTLVGSVTHGTDSGDTRFSVNSANQYTMVFKNAGNIAGQIGGSGSDVLRFSNAAGATTLEANSGQFTLPLQPAFQIKSGTSQDNISINANTTVVMANEHFDVGSNVASNTFTAPVTGKYQLSYQIRLDQLDIDTSYYIINLVTSNRSYQYIQGTSGFDADMAHMTFAASQLCDMDASDTAFVQVSVLNAGAAQVDITTESTFSGFLAC